MTNSPEAPELPASVENALCALAGLLTAAACGALGWTIHEFWPFTVDDTFITLRYAEHLAAGHGPVFNLEPPRAEGYTSFLWMVVLALPHLAGVDALFSAKALSVFFGAGTVAVAFLLAAHLSESLGPRLRYLPAAFTAYWLAAFAPTSVHSVSGMETSLASFLFVLLVYCAVTGRSALLPVLGLLLGLTRPEANAVVIPILIYHYLSGEPASERAKARLFARRVALQYVLPGALYFAWRSWYFGHLFPIPFYMKIGSQEAFAGTEHAFTFVHTLLRLASFPLAGYLLRRSRASSFVLGSGLLWLVISALPANIMDYDNRFAFPAEAPLLAAAGYGLAVWLRLAMGIPYSSARRAVAGLAGAVLLVAVTSHLILFANFDSNRFQRRSYGAAIEGAHIRLGKILGKFQGSKGQRPKIAIGDAGAIPYYSGWQTIDTYGLNDTEVGIRGNHDPSYFLDQQPDLVVIVSSRQQEFRATEFFPREDDFYAPIQRAGFKRLAIMTFSIQSHLWIMGDPESDVGRYVRNEVGKLVKK